MRVAADTVWMILDGAPEIVLGARVREAGVGRRVFRTTVPAEVAAGTTVEQSVRLTLGSVQREPSGDSVSVGVSWEPVGLQRVLPSFTGDLRIGPAEGRGAALELRGTYRVPLGPVGRFGDSVVGHRVARRSLDRYVDRLAARLDHEAVRRGTASTVRPAPYNDDLRPHTRTRRSVEPPGPTP